MRTSQNQPSGVSREMEGAGDGSKKSYDDLLEEIDELKAELEERPSQEEVRIVVMCPLFFLTVS